MAFNPNAYGNPASKSRAVSRTVKTTLETSPAKFPVSESLLQSRWSDTQHTDSKPAQKRRAIDDENTLSGTKKRDENSVIQSLSLQSSPRQPAARTNTKEICPSTSCATEIIRGNDNTILDSKAEETAGIQCPLANSASDKAEVDNVEHTDCNGNMPMLKNQVADNGDQLRALQQMTALQISQKVEGQRKRAKAKHNTVRLEDLYLARRPVDVDDPSASVRTWIEDPQQQQDDYTSSKTRAVDDEQEVSIVAQATEDPRTLKEVSVPVSKRASRWPSNADMRPEKAVTDENAWGSDVSDDTRANNSADQSYGKLFNKKRENHVQDNDLVDWEGKLMPAPADWHERPRFNNNNMAYKSGFDMWLSTARRQARFSNGLPVFIVSNDQVEDVRNHPDGISMVDEGFKLNTGNLHHYDYEIKDPDERKYLFEPAHIEFKKEKANPLFAKYKDETTEMLVDNWLKHRENARQLSVNAGVQASAIIPDSQTPIDTRYTPELNIYLRPATKADLEELVRIYNTHVEHGVAPSETFPITYDDMESRMNTAANGHLPLIVAAKMSQKGARVLEVPDNEAYSSQRQLPVQHRQRQQLSCVEILAGFACAMDLMAADYIERTSAELEVYVDPLHSRKGVGKCLLDKILQICDRGHRLTTNCDFHCAPEIRHFYEVGGRRDLHKLYLLYRKWHVPKSASIQVEGTRKHRKLPMRPTREDDYGIWLRSWLESYNFEVEGLLRKVGAKNGRYVDLVYFGRETLWQPLDGHVPPPDPQLYSTAQEADDYEGDEEEGVAI